MLAVCYRLPDAVGIRSGDTAGRIERRATTGEPEYRIIASRGLPLGYPDALYGTWLSAEAWLAATALHAFPDVVPQLAELFTSPRCGEIVIFAADDWSFGTHYASGHGSLSARDARVHLYFRGPGFPAGHRAPPARIVDVTPTLLDLLGVQAEGLDGVSRLTTLRGGP